VSKTRMLAAAGFVFASAWPAAAQDTNLDHARELISQVQAQQGGQPATLPKLAPVPQTSAPFRTPGPVVDLGLEDAVQKAMDKNIDIAVARITPRLTDFTIAGLEANYRVNLTSALNNTSTSTFPTQTIQGISSVTTSQRNQWSAGIAQNLFRGGGNYSVGWTNSRLNSPSTVNIRNPQYSSGITANITQPLLRGFKIDSTRASLQTNRLSQSNDEITLTATSATTAANVRNAYWDLVYALGAVEAAQNSLDLANRLVQDNQSRVEIGTLAPIDVVSAQAEAASRRNTLVQSQAAVRTSELVLKRLLVSGTEDPLWTSSINPVDRPSTAPEPINIEAAVARALADRTDLQQSKNNLKISDINLRNQVDATRPQLNLVGAYGLNGVGGNIFSTSRITDPITGISTTSSTLLQRSGYFDSLRNIGGLDAPTWSVGLNFAFPLGASAQEATVARSKLSLQQTEVNLKALELQIATEVMNAGLTVQSNQESVQATIAARELALKRLEAAQSKLDVGMATNYEVVQAQRDFADARIAELRAILNYRKAIVNYETAQRVGTRGVGAAVTGGGAATGATGGTGGTGGGGTGGQ
jgi:outer membrane protein